MPLLKLETTVALPHEKKKTLLAALSKAVADTIGKPEQYVMVTTSQSAMLMSGKAGEAAFVPRPTWKRSPIIWKKLSFLATTSHQSRISRAAAIDCLFAR